MGGVQGARGRPEADQEDLLKRKKRKSFFPFFFLLLRETKCSLARAAAASAEKESPLLPSARARSGFFLYSEKERVKK